MLYIIIGITGLLIIVALFTFLSKKNTSSGEAPLIPDADCCGAHEICEKGLKKADPYIDYFNDEELDIYRNLDSDDYSDEQLEMFREVLYTLKQEEINDWLISLEKRNILFPDRLKPELLDIIG